MKLFYTRFDCVRMFPCIMGKRLSIHYLLIYTLLLQNILEVESLLRRYEVKLKCREKNVTHAYDAIKYFPTR